MRVQSWSEDKFLKATADVGLVHLLAWLVSLRLCQQLGNIADGPQDRASDNFTCCHT